MRNQAWAHNTDEAIQVFAATLEQDPEWSVEFPRGGSVHNTIKRARDMAKQLIDAGREGAAGGHRQQADEEAEELC